MALPVLIYPFPALVDWPNHVVRHLLVGQIEGDRALAEVYWIAWRWIPNLAADLVAWPTGASAHAASRGALALAMGGWIAGPVVLYRALWGRWSPWPLASALVVYNATLLMGFENFYLTVPVAVGVFAAWVATDDRPLAGRVAILTLAAGGIWLGHLVVWGLLALMIGSWEAGRRQIGRVAAVGVAFLPGTGAFLWQQAHAEVSHGGGTHFGSVVDRLRAVFSPVLHHDPVVDVFVLIVLVYGVFGLAAHARSLKIHPRMAPVLVVVAIASALMPSVLSGVHFMDQRLPCVLVGLALAGTDIEGLPRTRRRWIVALTCLALGARLARIHPRWAQHTADTRELLTLADHLPAGARVLPAGHAAAEHVHTAAWLVPEASVFLPSLFTGAHLLRVQPGVERITHPQMIPVFGGTLAAARDGTGPFAPDALDPDVAFLRTWWRDFDYLLWLEAEPPTDLGPLEQVAEGSWFGLYATPSVASPSGSRAQ